MDLGIILLLQLFGGQRLEAFAHVKPSITKIDINHVAADLDGIAQDGILKDHGNLHLIGCGGTCQVLHGFYVLAVIKRTLDHGNEQILVLRHLNTDVVAHLTVFIVHKAAIRKGHDHVALAERDINVYTVINKGEVLCYTADGNTADIGDGNAVVDHGNDA